MIEVPLHVINDGNEGAYIAGAMRRIAANAHKSHIKRMENDKEFAALVAFIDRKADNGSGFFVSIQKAISQYGKMSEKQEATCRRIMSEDAARMAEMRSRDAGSEFVGSLKERRIFTVEITGFKAMVDYDGEPDGFFHALKDEAGNVLVYRGSVELGKKGDKLTLKATVRSHYDGKGVKTTYINRPVVQEN
jgi:hypothetical protein